MTPDELKRNVDTVVVVMMENRSFDHVLGYLRHPDHGNRTDVDGIEDLANEAYVNINLDGEGKRPYWMPDGPLSSDLPHDAAGTAVQLKYSVPAKRYLMTGFVEAFEKKLNSKMAAPLPMGLLRPQDLPTTSMLADRYCVCDRWFACVPTSTAPNRLMALCGATPLDNLGVLLPNQPTVYDWLLDHGVRWRVYAAGLPFFMLMPRLLKLVLTGHFRRLGELAHDLATESPDERPQVIFIEPEYYDSPVHFRPPCDNHPPLGIAAGEAFVAEAYQALAQSPLWCRSVFILTYDEHGGFFDHVPPLPVSYRHASGVGFDTTGLRTPAIIAGPYAPRGVSHVPLDHTSILQLLAERFGSSGESYSMEVLDRQRQGIRSVSEILEVAADNTQTCRFAAPADVGTPASVGHSELSGVFHWAIRELLSRHRTEAVIKYPELRRDFKAA